MTTPVTGSLLVLVLALGSLGGCIADEPNPTSDAPGPAAATTTAPIVWTDCQQWHLHFDARAEDFAGDVPPGFTVAADDLGLTTFLIHVTLCAQVNEALLAVPVVPPADHEDADRSEVAVVQVFHDGPPANVYPKPFEGRLVESTFTLQELPGGPQLTIEGGGETTELTLALSPSSGTFPPEHWARFAAGFDADDRPAIGVVTADGSGSTNVGAGSVAYRHEGPGGAPPATGGVAHVVSDLDVTFTSEVRA